jgi:2-C-methyl-D-erythritol 4-phosphate cytidylyltransferase
MLLLAAGRGERLGGAVPKAFVDCAGATLFERSLRRLARVELRPPFRARTIVAAVPAGELPHVEASLRALRALGLERVVLGGATRQESMAAALAAADPAAELVLVHDAARPFFPLAAAAAAMSLAWERGAALLAVRAPDTMKRVDGEGRVRATLDRADVWLAQTPQVARRSVLAAALERARADGFTGTDDVSLLEHAGAAAYVVEGSAHNLKVTTRADLELAELLARREDELP